MSKYKRYAFRGILAGLFVAIASVMSLTVLGGKQLVASSGRDCEPNSVIWGGGLSAGEIVDKYDHAGLTHTGTDNCSDGSKKSYPDIAAIYSAFGISSEAIHSLPQTGKMGSVHKDGTVWVDGQQYAVASDALSAGRLNFPGSTPIPGTGAFMRPPSVSFNSNSLQAYIGYENGKPAFAIIASCGNPIKFPKPRTHISKSVYQQGTGINLENTNVTNNTDVTYHIVVRNDGDGVDGNVIVNDQMPTYHTYNATVVGAGSSARIDNLTTSGINIGNMAPGQIIEIWFSAHVKVPTTLCGNHHLINTVFERSDRSPSGSDTASVDVNIPCIGQCKELTAPDYDLEVGQSTTFTASAITQNLTATSYVFSVNGNERQNSDSNTFVFSRNKPGTFTVSVVVNFSNGTHDGGSGACVKQVNVAQPAVVCDSLTAPTYSVLPGQPLLFTAHATASGGATVNGYKFSVDDKLVQDGDANANTYNFQEDKAGDHKVSVVVKSSLGDKTSDQCVKHVEVQEVPAPVCVSLSLTPNSTIQVGTKVTAVVAYDPKGATFKQASFNFGDNSAVVNTSTSSGNTATADHTFTAAGNPTVSASVDFEVNGQTVTKNGSQCAQPLTVASIPVPPQPPIIPKTGGVGDVLGIFAATSLFGAVFHRIWTVRKYGQ